MLEIISEIKLTNLSLAMRYLSLCQYVTRAFANKHFFSIYECKKMFMKEPFPIKPAIVSMLLGGIVV